MMRFLLRRSAWIIPVVLALSFLLYTFATRDDLLGALRLVLFYFVGLLGVSFAKLSNIRQLRELARSGDRPSVYLVADLYRNLALILLLLALLLVAINTFFPGAPNLPRGVVLGLIGSGCAAFFVTGLIQQFAGKRRLGGMPVNPGPLRIFTVGVRRRERS